MNKVEHGLITLVVGMALVISLPGCGKKQETNVVEAPRISCEEIVLEYGQDFNVRDYCTVEGKITVTDIDTTKEGKQTLSITAERQGALSFKDVEVTVKPKPMDCPRNMHLSDDQTECLCNNGYQKAEDGKGCILIPEKEKEQEKTPEPTVEPTPEPTPVVTPEPTQEPSTNQNNNNNNSGGYSGSGQGYSEQPVQQPESHGSINYWPYEYGGFDEAFNACVAQCETMNACSCEPMADGQGYVLNY